MLAGLLHEIGLQSGFFENETVETIYIGGGTPSLLSAAEIRQLIEKVRAVFKMGGTVECTLEANPDDITAQKIQELAGAGINRLSIGIQSFFDEDLLYMNRGHNAAQAAQCIPLTIENGIPNFSVDLIFGYPLLSDDKWKKNIERVLQYPVPHISCYGMTVEPKTALADMIAKNKTSAPDDMAGAGQYEYLMETLMQAGYEHYEISNFAKKGFESKHNSSYWKDQPYLGIGPSAHSYNGTGRQWNVANNALYMSQISKGLLPFEIEILTRKEKLNERIMVGLRTANGLPLHTFLSLLDVSERKSFEVKMNEYSARGLLLYGVDGHLRLTQNGKLFADGIASDLFL